MTVDYSRERNELEYWIAVESIGENSNNFTIFEIPEAKWIVFNVKGPFSSAVPDMWRKICSEWLPNNDFVQSDAPSLEVYKSEDQNSPNAESEIWIPVK